MDAKLLFVYETIDSLDVAIEYTRLPDDRDGEYDHDARVIRLNRQLATRLHRSTLAHECCHAVFGDVPSRFGPVNAKQERRADEWAAIQLIELDDYIQKETHHDGHVEAMAVSLNVTVDLIEAYRRLLLRTDRATYVAPRMGTAQFAHKIEVG